MTAQTVPSFDVDREKNKLTLLVSEILSQAKESGATACEVQASSNMGLSATARMGSVETVEFNQDQGFGITVYFGQRKGSASTTDTSLDTVTTAVAAACNIAKYTQEDDCAGLADATAMAAEFPDLDLYHPWGIDADQAIKMALTCEQAARDSSNKITNSEGATISSHQGCAIYGNSHGFIGSSQSTRHNVSCVVIAKDRDEMQRDYWFSHSRDPLLLENMEVIGRKAADRTIERLGSRKVSTGKFPVIFQAAIAPSLIGHFVSGISGGSLYRDASFLKDSLGKQVFPGWLHIHENPYLQKGLSSSAFDADGLQTRKQDFVVDGKVSSYILGTYSARKLGMASTANAGGTHNLFVDSNAGDLDELLQTMHTGLLVTEFMGHSVNIVTGDYSRGVSGFWIENGKILYPVAEVTIAGNLKDMFANIVKTGSDFDYRNSTHVGSVLIEEMMIGGE